MSVVDGLVVTPLVKWLNSSGSVQQSIVGLSLNLTFSPLKTSDAGTYQCVSVITIENISVYASNSASKTITVQGEVHTATISGVVWVVQFLVILQKSIMSTPHSCS